MHGRLARDSVVNVAVSIFGHLRRRSVLLLLALIVLFLLSLPAWGPLASPGYPHTHDYGMDPILLIDMDKCFQDGQLPCRWVPDLQKGYGLPAFNYYPPLPYYVGELIHLGGVGVPDTIKVLFIIGFVMSALFMFLLAREFWGNLGGLVGAVFYVYAPYHAVDVYVTGRLGEHWALAFFPAILWGIYKVIKEGKPVYVLLLALSVFALLLSHNLMVMIFFPVAVVWAAVFLLTTRQWPRLAHLAIAGVAGFSLAAFFTLPALLEQDLTHVEEVKTGFFYYGSHFPTIKQLFLDRFWGYGDSRPGDGDLMSFQIGWLHWGLTAVSVLIAPFLWRRSRAAFLAVVVLAAFFWGSVFAMHPRSDFLWQTFSWLQWQQFPWRFLALAIFTSSFLAGAIVLLASQRWYLPLLLSIVLIGAVIVMNQGFFHFGTRVFSVPGEQFPGAGWAFETQSSLDYLRPADAAALPPEATPAPALVQVVGGDADITEVRQGSASLAFAAESTSGARLRTSVVDFPNWRVKVDGKTIPHDHADDLAAISFYLPPGAHQVKLSFEDTALRTFSNYLSLVAWALFIVSAAALAGKAARSALVNALAARAHPTSLGRE